MAFDLVICNAWLRSRKSLAEIGIEGGRIRRIARSAGQRGRPIYDMITVNAARALNLGSFGLRAGALVHLVVLDRPSVYEVLWEHRAPSAVVSHGRLVDPELPRPGRHR